MPGSGTGVPGTETQVHDNNGGIFPSGLFWTVQLPDDAFRINHSGTVAQLRLQDVSLFDQFVFGGPIGIPSTVNLSVRWEATGSRVHRGKGKTVPADDISAFSGELAFARSTATISGSEFGFRFKTDPGATTDPNGFAEMGSESNGAFL